MYRLLLIVLSLLSGSLSIAKTIDVYNSRILSPTLGSTVMGDQVTIAGIIYDERGKPLRRERVNIFVDNRKVGSVISDDQGVWSYYLCADQALELGVHSAQAEVEFSRNNSQVIRGTLFIYAPERSVEHMTRSGNVSVYHSSISYPFNGAQVNTTRPTIMGVLYNISSRPVANESVQVKINGVTEGTVSSNSNGLFSYTLTPAQALSETTYSVGAYCVQSNVNLTSNTFSVDVTPPSAPSISQPTQGATLGSGNLTVEGNTEANAMVVSYLDGDSYGDVIYADGSGDWSIDYTLASGSHTLEAQAEDPAGNASGVSSPVTFTVSV